MALFILSTGKKESYMTVLDVGQGDGILYHSRDGEVCMIDGGSTSEKEVGKYVIKPALEYYGIDCIDYWFLSHYDEDHISGAVELLEMGFNISNLILPYRKEVSERQMEIESLAEKNHTKLYYMRQRDKVKLKNSTFYCLAPHRISVDDENQNSMVLLLDCLKQQILLTGDVEKEGEADMLKYLNRFKLDYNKTQILKVGHHGSANGTKEELLDYFRPDAALISCGIDNSYGHPAKETVDRIKKSGASVFYTMKQGAIEIRLENETSYLGYGVLK